MKENKKLKHPERITERLKEKVNEFNTNGIKFPCGFSDINRFENNNNITINVFGFHEKEEEEENEEIFPLRVSEKKGNNHVNILLIENNGKKHCLIKSMSRLLVTQFTNRKNKIYICNYCLQKFGKEEILNNHLEYSSKHKCGKTVFRKKGDTTKFVNYERIHKVPYVIYSDTECYLEVKNNKISIKITQIQKHKLSGYCYVIKFFDDQLYPLILRKYTKKYPKEDVASKFVKCLEKDVREIFVKFKFPKRIIFKDVDEKDFKHAEKCYACKKEFKNEKEKVADHCHYAGKYRGAACISCNSKMKKTNFIPTIFFIIYKIMIHICL